MACKTCKQPVCCCTGNSETTTCSVEKNCLGEQDICFGFGESNQVRNGRKVTVSKINCNTIPCPDGESVGEHLAKAHTNYNSVADTFEDMTAPDGSTVPYAKKLNVGDTVVIGNCVYENMLTDNQTRPETDTSNGWLNLCDVAKVSKCTDAKGILEFSSCDALAAYDGTEECPLYDGMLAVVRDANGCFELYSGKWFTDNAGTANDGDACGDHLTHHPDGADNKEFRWTSYSKCHPDTKVTALNVVNGRLVLKQNNGEPDLSVAMPDLNITDFVRTSSGYMITRSDGTTYEALDPDVALPNGGFMFVDQIGGNFVTTIGTGKYKTYAQTGFGDVYKVLPNTQTFTVADYPMLGESGHKLNIVATFNTAYNVDSPTYDGVTNDAQLNPYQWSGYLKVNGVFKPSEFIDGHALSKGGSNETLSTSILWEHTTDGNDLTIEVGQWLYDQGDTAPEGIVGDKFNIDVTTQVVTFTAVR